MGGAGSEELVGLVARAKLGCREALEQLLQRSVPVVRLMLRTYIGDPEDAKDVHQEVLLDIARSVHAIEEPVCYPRWLANLTLNRTLDFFRKRRRGVEIRSYQASRQGEDGLVDEKDSLLELVWKEFVEQVEDAIEALPARYREVLALRILEGLDTVEIVARTGRKPGTVRAQLSRGMEKLRRKLEQA